MDTVTYNIDFLKKLDVIGFNMSIIPSEEDYVGLLRDYNYDTKHNTIYIVKLDRDFNTKLQVRLDDITGRKIHSSWTSGLEDPRIISDKHFLAVTCDTNDRWKPEMSFIDMDIHSNTITRVQPMALCNQRSGAQKNWLYIRKHNEECYDLLYDPHPFCVMRMNINSGNGFYLKEHTMLDKYNETRINSAAIMTLHDGYLLLVRIKSKDGTWYHSSRWIKLDKDYSVVGVSPQFRFMEVYNGANYVNEDGSFKSGGVEICMSIHQEGEHVVACTSLNDAEVFIFKYKLADILESLKME